jgi:hypothetical protein
LRTSAFTASMPVPHQILLDLQKNMKVAPASGESSFGGCNNAGKSTSLAVMYGLSEIAIAAPDSAYSRR